MSESFNKHFGTSTVTGANEPKKRTFNRSLLILVVGLAVVLLALWLVKRHNDNKNNPYKTSYSQFVNETLAGQGSGNSIIFQRPTDFSPVSPGNLGYITYFGQLAWDKNAAMISSEVAQSTAAPGPNASAQITKGLNSAAASDSYKGSAAYIKNAISQTISYLYYSNSQKDFNLEMGQASKTGDSSLKTAWTIPFTASGDTSDPQLRDVKGEVLFAVGKTNYYFLTLSALKDNWNSNHGAWERIFNNVKVDQSPDKKVKGSFLPGANSKSTLNTCIDSYNQTFIHEGGCTSLELQSQSFNTALGCYNSQGDFLTLGGCNE